MIINVTKEIDSRILEGIDDQFAYTEPFSRGWYGEVYQFQIQDKLYAVKKFKPTMAEGIGTRCYCYDYDILKDLGTSRHFPRLVAYKEGEWMMTQFIFGKSYRYAEDQESFRGQIAHAFHQSISRGWYPIDIKGENVLVSDTGIFVIVDVGEFLPVLEGVPFDVDKRVDFVIQNVNQYPSVKDVDPYNLADLMKKEA